MKTSNKMKKSLISLFAFIFLGIVFISCSKEETQETLPPTISFLTGTHPGSGLPYIKKDTTLKVGAKFAIGISATTQSGENLKRLYIKSQFEVNTPRIIIDKQFDSPSINYDTTVFAYPNPGFDDFEFTVWDKNDQSATIKFTITTEPLASNILTFEDKILGAQANPTGSSFATESGDIYTLEEAKNNSDKVDFLYYYLDPDNATLAAPDNTTAISIFTGTYGLNTWDNLNATRFESSTLSSADFNAIQSSSALVAACTPSTPATLSKMNNLTAGKVISFQTHDNLFGLIRIDAINGENNAGTMEISVKVQPD
jgi:hypothetical protein